MKRKKLSGPILTSFCSNLSHIRPRHAFERRRVFSVFVALALACSALFRAEQPTSAARGGRTDYKLVVAVTPPGVPSQGDCTMPVLRYRFTGTDALNPMDPIPGCPTTLLNDPAGVAFNTVGELFVGNRHRNVGMGEGSISRFTFDSEGNYIPNGVITGNGLEAVHGLAFSPNGELFAANLFNDTISRFVFDKEGNAIPNGVISNPQGSFVEGLAFSPNGELFVTTYTDVSRYIFGENGEAIFNGSFRPPSGGRLHLLAFGPQGELFLPALDDNLIYRYWFDSEGNPVPNGTISIPNPVSIAFSPEGEMFVVSGFSRLISRFLFDENGTAIPNGTVSREEFTGLGGVAVAPF